MAKLMSVVGAALALLAAGIASAWAQDAPPVMKVGVVDLELVGRKFERKVQEEDKLTQWYAQEQQYLRELGNYIFCLSDEWDKAAAILRTPKLQRTKEQQDDLKGLLDEATKREKQYQDLRAKQAGGTLTQEEQDTYKQIEDIAKTRDAKLSDMVKGLEGELQKRMADVREQLMKPVRDTVNAVAAEKGFTLILEKDYVYFGGEDVTEDVIKKLNETAPPAAAPAGQPKPEAGAAPGGEKPKEGAGEQPAEGGGNP